MYSSNLYPSGTERWILVLTAIICAVLELIDSTIVNVSLREISGSIGATTMEIGWISTAYGIGNVIVIPLSGLLSNLYGRKNYFTASIAVFTIASLMCGLSDQLWTLIIWRFVQGLAGGGLLSTAMSIVIGAFPPEQARTAFITFAVGILLGPTFGPVLGGYLTDNLSWHWIFYVNVPIGIVAAIFSWRYVNNLADAKKPKKIDVWGILFITIALGSLQYVLEEGSIHDWFESNKIKFFFVLSLLASIAFVWRELTAEEPAVNIKLYSNFNLVLGSIISLLIGIMLNGTLFIFPMLTQGVLGWTATETGAFLISGGLAGAVAMILSKKIFANTSPKVMMLIGLIIVIISLIPLGHSSLDSGNDQFFWPFIIRYIGTAFIIPNMVSLSVGNLRGKDLAQSTGLATMLRQLGGAIGVAIIGIYTTNNGAFVRANITPYVNEYNPVFQERIEGIANKLLETGMSKENAYQAALAGIEKTVVQQQTLISYNHGFILFAILIGLCIPVVLAVRRTKKENEESSENQIEIH
jgi:DHA2 family multidrug resistance protein